MPAMGPGALPGIGLQRWEEGPYSEETLGFLENQQCKELFHSRKNI